MNDIDTILAELEQLARLASRMPDLVVKAGPPGSGYSFNYVRREISMDGARLVSESRNFLRGLLLHEVAHAILTRLQRHATTAYCRQVDIRLALNAVEDARIESWLQVRFPGARAWIREYNAKLLRNTVPEMQAMVNHGPGLPPLHEFLASLLARWWHGPDSIQVPKRCVPLLDQVWLHFERLLQARPEALPGDEVALRYARSPVKSLYRTEDLVEPPTPFEMAVRLAQADAWDIIEEGIMPVFRKLAPPREERPHPHLREIPMFARLLDRLDGFEDRPLNSRNAPTAATIFNRAPAYRGKHSARAWMDNQEAYFRLARTQSDAIDQLVDAIQEAFPPESRSDWTGPCQTGIRLRLRSVQQAEANPRCLADIWERRSPPRLPKPHLAVLVDRSGSMQGERIAAATAGCVLLAEVSRRADLPLSLFAFADECSLVLEPGGAFDEAEGRIGGLLKAASGGTEMPEALRQVADHMEKSPAAHRLVIVLGDGEADTHEVGPVARRMEECGVILLALGVGPNTHDMQRCFSRARTGLEPGAIPGTLAALLRHAVTLGRS